MTQQVITIRPDQMTTEQWATWKAFHVANPSLDSPYFHPGFTRAIAAVRSDVEIAVFREEGRDVGYFPYQRSRWNFARPAGGPLSDFQSVIASEDFECDPKRLVQGCGLSGLDFDHLLISQPGFLPYCHTTEASPYMDVSGGFEAYCKRRRQSRAKSDEIAHAVRKERKIRRDHGPIRFESNAIDEKVLDAMFAWKSGQYQSTGMTNVFAFSWTRDLLRNLLFDPLDGLSGILSTLYLGDRPIAIHYGIRAGSVLHSWFPAYDSQYSKYSPGLLLLVEILKAAESQGITRIDLGKGQQTYKARLKTGHTDVAQGSVEGRSILHGARRSWRATRAWVKKSPFRAALQTPARWVRHVRERALFN